jgi:hypothetical protein
MYVQLSHGKDSLRRQGNSLRRNCEIKLWTLINSEKGFEIIPMYVAYQRKIAGYGDTSIVRDMPATEQFSPTDAGKWWESRYEVAPMTEILVEYDHYDQSGGLIPNYEYLLLVVDPNAPLWRISVELPPHHLAAVPTVHFEGRFHLVTDEEQLPQRHQLTWRKHLSVPSDAALQDILDPYYEAEDQVFNYQQLEGGKTSKVIVNKTPSKLGAGRIRRVRNIVTR